ncbi:tagatose-6-phosphate kinase 2 [Streptococcus suis]|uniref:Tagatose-6-phosphate kinase n=2 Tax=Streptococcus suis TaxID=1307 RepID=D5AHR3_STRGZ|nr:Tagatose-6-phosphate kinase [Streptococcus suis GZ1]ADV70098.1 tagatose-6-phosphate kinase 2 [Streptococcus suis JS14]AER15145.1 tagatose-6-phosphate kinase 2 [Streptococcus suis SS12]AER21281.1 tagatose-6-phosphate kinase 2 [Streptococcus suis ST1]AER44236.1 tagatose-6-phosphate kinase 2 [Streptococcus suis A7]AFR00369.1 tagatose-6-phosphate kinase [Streptococcus suis S735]AGG64445.1 Tagatose-6-phosphate kinase [Streptococcus suis SC070731]AKG40352.1 tagatose-6-phosphate kinase [Streptoc
MILTITLNPSVDIAYHLDTFHLDTVNRVEKSSKNSWRQGAQCHTSFETNW